MANMTSITMTITKRGVKNSMSLYHTSLKKFLTCHHCIFILKA